MTRDELNEVLEKLRVYEGRTFTEEQGDAWYEVLRKRTLQDSLAAVVGFHSEPFTHPAYPGDINGLVEDIERARLAPLGSLELNEADWAEGTTISTVSRRLHKAVRQGRMTADGYRAYQRSGMTVEAFMAQQEATVSG